MTDAQVSGRAHFVSPIHERGDRAKPAPATSSGTKKRSGGFGAFFLGVCEAFDARGGLFKLELKRNGISGAYIAAFAVGGALLAVTAWLLLVAAVVGGVLSAGLHWALAVVIALALQAIAIFVLVRAMRASIRNLTFAAVRRSWSPKHSKGPNGPIS